MSNREKGKIKDLYELTPMQEGMLYHSLLNKESFAYVGMFILDLRGGLDYKYLQESFNKLIERYDILRTVFVYEKVNRPIQIVLNQQKADMCFEDIVQLSKEDKESFIEDFKIKEKKRNFDLTKEIPIRLSVIKTDENSYKLVWTVHHIIMDGWSCGIIFKEFLDIHESLKWNKSLSLGEVHPFSDYIKWLQKQDNEETSSYWREYLNNYTKQANLPKNKVKTKNGEYKQRKIDFTISKDIKEELEDIAYENDATLNTIIQAAWGILLQKYNNTNDIVFGVVVSGRSPDIPGIEKMVGLFINTFPLRIQSFPNRTFTELVKEIYQSSIETNKHTYYPLAEIQSSTELKQDLIDHIMVFENYPIESLNDLEDAELDFSVENVEKFEQTNYDFNILIDPWKELHIEFIYNALMYDENTVQKIKEHFENILKNITHQPKIPIKDIEILNPEEKNDILYNFNNTEVEYPKDKTITELFEEQAELTPDNIAITYEDKQLTYRELNEKSNQLARVLRDKGVKPDNIIGLLLERSPEMIIGILGVLKAGGVYMPIDPQYPTDRISYMMEDSKAYLLLVSNDSLNYSDLSDYEFSMLNLESKSIYQENTDNLDNVNKTDDLAYVIYTSGTTGRPKGVMIEHQSITNTIQWSKNEFKLNDKENILILFSYVFDGFIQALFTPLISGSKVVLLNEDDARDPLAIKNTIKSNQITHFLIVPSLYSAVLHYSHKEDLQTVKTVTLAGENTSKALIKESIEKNPHLELINDYGPSENAITTTIHRNMTLQSNGIIGKPISNTRIYIFDVNFQPQPIGVPGELCISGDGLARGYLNNSQLTDEMFMDNPFTPGERIYRTGDLARWLPDGNIEFLGRIDHQVKIRGYRIEPGEIENQLLKHPQIKETIITAQNDSQDDNFLCAYYVADEKITTKELRKHLSKELPDYMIPSYFIKLEKMPLTPNGKINRKALPQLDGSIQTGVEYIAPQNEVEEKLLPLWQNILGMEKIGIKDNFFELGGHSLKATALISQVHKEFNIALPLKKVFQTPTIKEMAEYIKNAQKSIYSSIKPAKKQKYYPMSSAQKRLYILDKIENTNIAYNLPGVMLVEGPIKKLRFEEVFQELIQRHETLRTSFEMVNGEPVQKIHEEVDFNINYLESTEEEAEEIVRGFVKPFDLNQAPLLRVNLIKIKENKHLLLFDMHHIISDGISMNILVQEFISLHQEIKLPDLRIQYKDYSVWQKERSQQENLEKQEKYWLEVFKDEIPILDLPLDHPRPPVQSFEGGSLKFEIDRELVEKINSVAQDSGATLYMIFLAAFNTLLSRYTGQEDMVVGSPIAGRPHSDLENIIGMFVNTLAMRNHPQGEKTFTQFLKEVRENALKAYESQDYQFEELVEKLNIKRNLSRNPLFDVMFVVQNIDMNEVKIEGLKFTPYHNPFQISKFDLTLTAIETKKGINFEWEYRTQLFEKETIERLAKLYISILESIVANPDLKLKDIKIPKEVDKKTLLFDFNKTEVDDPEEEIIAELFEERVESAPDDIALVYGSRCLTYGELHNQVDQLTSVLRDKGVENGSIVGLMVDHSLEMIIAVLSIRKVGGSSLIADPDYPPDRIEYMLENSDCEILLSQEKYENMVSFRGEFINLENPHLFTNKEQ